MLDYIYYVMLELVIYVLTVLYVSYEHPIFLYGLFFSFTCN